MIVLVIPIVREPRGSSCNTDIQKFGRHRALSWRNVNLHAYLPISSHFRTLLLITVFVKRDPLVNAILLDHLAFPAAYRTSRHAIRVMPSLFTEAGRESCWRDSPEDLQCCEGCKGRCINREVGTRRKVNQAGVYQGTMARCRDASSRAKAKGG